MKRDREQGIYKSNVNAEPSKRGKQEKADKISEKDEEEDGWCMQEDAMRTYENTHGRYMTVDSGASSHMFKADTELHEPTGASHVRVNTATGTRSCGIKRGTARVTINTEDGTTQKVKFQHALTVEGLAEELISVPKLVDAGKAVIFSEKFGSFLIDQKKIQVIQNLS